MAVLFFVSSKEIDCNEIIDGLYFYSFLAELSTPYKILKRVKRLTNVFFKRNR